MLLSSEKPKYTIIINNNKRPLTPESMPPSSGEHMKLKTLAPNTYARRKGILEINKSLIETQLRNSLTTPLHMTRYSARFA